MPDVASARSGFWARPTVWKAILIIVVYLAFYLAVGWVVGKLFAGQIDDEDPLANFSTILLGTAVPIAIGGAALLWFAHRRGWVSDIFGPQPVHGRGWMWVAPVLVLAAIVGHLVATDWSSWDAGQLAAVVVLGACVGFTEELATRGLVVKMVRDAGHRESFVAAVSSLTFALMHTVNLISGMAAATVLATVVYTLGFGACMYLSMRLTGTIWAAILLHGLTDPTTFLALGGVDKAVTDQTGGAATLALVATTLIILFGVVSLFFVRGTAASSSTLPAQA